MRRALLRAAPLWFARTRAPTHAELGELGELLAARHLRAQGLRVLGRRVATARGELDLVCVERGRLVCAEVKTSLAARGGAWRPGDRWRRAAFARHRAAARSLEPLGLAPRGVPARLDLVEVWIGARGQDPEIRHHKDLWGPLPRAP